MSGEELNSRLTCCQSVHKAPLHNKQRGDFSDKSSKNGFTAGKTDKHGIKQR